MHQHQHQQHHIYQHRRPGLVFVVHGSQQTNLRWLVLLLLFASILLSIIETDTLFVFAANQGDKSEDTMTIEGHLQYANRSPYNLSAEIVVNHGEYTTYSRTSDGNFTIHDIKPGVYIIDIISPIHHFSQVKCLYKPTNQSESLQQQQQQQSSSITDDTTPKKKPVFSCIEYYYPGATKRTIDDSNLLILTALASYEYFETKRGFSLLSILKNPMVLMMIFTGGIMYMLPKMMEGMDPEERAMMQKQIQMQQDPTKMMSSLFSGGSANDDLVSTTSAIRPQSSTTSSSPEGKSSSNHKQSKRNRK